MGTDVPICSGGWATYKNDCLHMSRSLNLLQGFFNCGRESVDAPEWSH